METITNTEEELILKALLHALHPNYWMMRTKISTIVRGDNHRAYRSLELHVNVVELGSAQAADEYFNTLHDYENLIVKKAISGWQDYKHQALDGGGPVGRNHVMIHRNYSDTPTLEIAHVHPFPWLPSYKDGPILVTKFLEDLDA